MTLKIAIQPDELVFENGERQSYFNRWFGLACSHDIDAIFEDFVTQLRQSLEGKPAR